MSASQEESKTISDQPNITVVIDDSSDTDSDVCKIRRKKRKSNSNAIKEDSDDESSEDSEVIVRTSRSKRKRKSLLDSESENDSEGCESENDSERCQVTETSSVDENSEMSTHKDFQRIRIISDVPSSPDCDPDSGQPYAFDEFATHTSSGLHDESRDDRDDEDVDSCSTYSESFEGYPDNEFRAYLQYMLSFCLDAKFLDHADSQDELKIAKTKMDRKIEDLKKMLQSQAWEADYKRAMETFPTLEKKGLGWPYKHRCEACKRQGRISSEILTFTGPVYELDNFESQEASSPSQTSFKVGRYCAERSKPYHRVFHYRFHLREKCVEAVNDFSGNDDATDQYVLTQCLDNEEWIKNEYRNFCSLIDSVTERFAALNKSENRTSNY